MNEPVLLGEFNRAVDRLSREIVDGNETTREVLAEAKRTNGRVYSLERTASELAIRLALLEKDSPLTKRDLWMVSGTLGAGMAVVKWLPALIKIGGLEP